MIKFIKTKSKKNITSHIQSIPVGFELSCEYMQHCFFLRLQTNWEKPLSTLLVSSQLYVVTYYIASTA